MSSKEHHALQSSLIHLLHRAGQTADELFAFEIGNSDLTPRQFAVLTALSIQETASQTEIVSATGIDRSTLADIVKRLVQRGLLARRRSRHDARAYAVRLTPQGHAALKLAAPAAQRAGERMMEMLSPARRAELIEGLTQLVTLVEPTAAAVAVPRKR